jgi:cell division protein FtsN
VSRDYKHRAQRKPEKKPLPGWLWLLTGLLLGGFIVGLVWLRGQSELAGSEWVGAAPDRPPQAPPAQRSPAQAPPPPAPRFDFYNMLPEMEVVVPVEELEEPAPARQADQPDQLDATYLVQIGSFRKAADADRLKAQLALLGFEAGVSSANLGPQDTRYRVRSGPHRGKAAVNAVRERLEENGFKGIVIRIDPR